MLKEINKEINDAFRYLDSKAKNFGEENKGCVCTEIRIGIYNDIIAKYALRGKEIFRGNNAEEKQKIFTMLGKEVLADFRRKQDAAVSAVLQCPRCGKRMRYMESVIRKNGKFLHRFDCKNAKCTDFERSIWIELTEKDCENILKRAKEDGKCKICGKLHGAKVLCSKEKGFVCEEHCLKCEFHDESGSRPYCRYNEEKTR